MSQAQSPTPSNGNPEGSTLHDVANQIEGLLGEDGEITDGRMSRAHPDYDHDAPHDEQVQPRDDKGKFTKKAAPSPDEETDDVADADQLAAGDPETEDSDESADTDEQVADSADQQAETDEQETEEGAAIETLAQFAEALEIPVEQLLESITDTFSAAGEETTVTLAELRSGYQKDADYRRQTQQLAENRRQAEQEYTLKMQQFDEGNRILAAHMQAMETMLGQQLEDPNLMRLRQTDPAEWSARREEIGNQIAGVQQARQHAMQQYAMFQQQQMGELRTREMNFLQQAMPDFKPDVHGEQARKIMGSIGYTPEETAKIFDHRLVIAALELGNLRAEVETLRAEKSNAQQAVKRVKKDVPKLQKPGKQQARAPIQRNNLARLKKRAAQTGSLEDAAAVIEAMDII